MLIGSVGYSRKPPMYRLKALRYGVGPRSWKSPSAMRRLVTLPALPVRSPHLNGRHGSPPPCQCPLKIEISSAPFTSCRSAAVPGSDIARFHSGSLPSQFRTARIHCREAKYAVTYDAWYFGRPGQSLFSPPLRFLFLFDCQLPCPRGIPFTPV